MIKISLFFLIFTSTIFSQQNVNSSFLEQSEETVVVELVRKKELLYSALKTRINLNGKKASFRVAEIKNGKSKIIKVPTGKNVLYVSGFGIPGQSSVSFEAKFGEKYSFIIAPRSSSYWAGFFGGVIGNAIESDLSSEGGGFRIALQSTSEIQKVNKDDAKNNASDLEEELAKLKNLYQKGLITEEVYKMRQKELISN
tara:strand:- start:1362 stop:1955 length:594 start_codon:yes stop_codon:yes gene_type:complete